MATVEGFIIDPLYIPSRSILEWVVIEETLEDSVNLVPGAGQISLLAPVGLANRVAESLERGYQLIL